VDATAAGDADVADAPPSDAPDADATIARDRKRQAKCVDRKHHWTMAGRTSAVLTGRYTRYFATFHPEVGDPYVAGGALDEQLQVSLGVRYAH